LQVIGFNGLNKFLVDLRIGILNEALAVPLMVCFQDGIQEQLLDSLLLATGLEADLHPELHECECPVDILEHVVDAHVSWKDLLILHVLN